MALAQQAQRSRWQLRLAAWINRVALSRRLVLGLTLAAIVSGVATYIRLTGSPVGPDQETLLILIVLNFVLLLPLAALILFRIVRLWTARRRGSAGSRLHLRLVLIFGLLAVTPAIIVAVFSALFFDLGIRAWFSDRVGTALRESLTITEKYVAEHILTLRRDIGALGDDINRNALQLMAAPNRLPNYVISRAQQRGIDHFAVFDRRGRIFVSTIIDFGVAQVQRQELQAAMAQITKDGQVAVLATRKDSTVRAVTRLTLFFDADVFLFVQRPIEQTLSSHIARMRAAIDDYIQLEGRRAGLEIGFFLLYAIVSLLLLLAAVWLGLYFANQIVRPVGALISASEKVRAGDLGVRVAETGDEDELASLGRSFNRMTSELERSREELIEANRQLDARREFTETVLAGVSAGVIGLDADGHINLQNRSANTLLSIDLDDHLGEPLEQVLPEFADMLNTVRRGDSRQPRAEVDLRRDGRSRTLLVQIASETLRGETVGYVVTFDDITELQHAQRTAAWADVARRIAHEIKNPLTPIQLSAERLRRKYLDEISTDRDVFDSCTETIIRQVGDIGRLVNEFSSFARMPSPTMKRENLVEICRRAIILLRTAHSEIRFEFEAPDRPVQVLCDVQQVSQAIANLLQNAVDSIAENAETAAASDQPHIGSIELTLSVAGDQALIEVADTGKGLPAELMDRLTEPYVTTRVKGTGLGLAIVRKIMDDHGGELAMANRDSGGARMTLSFPLPDFADGEAGAPVPDRAAE